MTSTPNPADLAPPEFLIHRPTWIAVNKPGGILTQAPPGIDSVELRMFRWLKHQAEKNHRSDPETYIGVPHRLDRPVSGVLLIGLNKPTTRRLARLFEHRQITKSYWAVVNGEIAEDTGTWTDFMRKIPDEAKSETVDAEHPEAQIAILNYRVLGRAAGLIWLSIDLETGRTHQIRVQCAARGCPIIGDEMYGATTSFGPQTPDLRQRWIGLHAREIAFVDPDQRDTVRAVAPLSQYWYPLVEQFPQMGK